MIGVYTSMYRYYNSWFVYPILGILLYTIEENKLIYNFSGLVLGEQ